MISLAASATGIEPFTAPAFDAAGKLVLVDVTAPRCPTGKAQHQTSRSDSIPLALLIFFARAMFSTAAPF